MRKPLKIGIVAGEESGNLLGVDLIQALREKSGRDIELVGVGGAELGEMGLKSLFDSDEIALIGLGAVLKKLPKLMARIKETATYLAEQKPDCVILIDSPDFTHRVAKKLKYIDASIPVIKYIAPSVWAWRPERAKKMCAYIDHVLVVLPFETDVLRKLNGPPATYVGHRLLSDPDLLSVRIKRQQKKTNTAPNLVILPGSRRSEIHGLMPAFGEAVAILAERIENLHVTLPTLPRHEAFVHKEVESWKVKPEIIVGAQEKWKSFVAADAALAASGTVSLELALSGIPMVLSYRADYFAKLFILPKVTIWSAALPNIIADEPIVPEYFNEFIRPGMLARQVERLMKESPVRQAQLEGFSRVWSTMKTEKPSGKLAADAVLTLLAKQ